ncbi:MAG: hypothetical protein Q8R88_06325 [Desulfoprunum sp.]|nr:hypothetical protein [Desulfoprunum sp.]
MKNSPESVLHREKWHDQLVEVIEKDDRRSLYFASFLLQSSMSLCSPQQLVLSYTRYMLLGLPAMPEPRHILIIGIGAGSLVRFCHHHFPDCRIDAVDCSAPVIDLARGYFQLPENRQVGIYCREGQAFLSEVSDSRRYDLILVDAYDHKGMSETIYTAPFFKLCATVLKEDGILSCNLWSSEPGRLQRIRDALRTFFQGHLYVPVPERGNVVILASPHPIPWQKFNRNNEEWLFWEQRFDLDFRAMLSTARRHNQTLLQRLAAHFRAMYSGGIN